MSIERQFDLADKVRALQVELDERDAIIEAQQEEIVQLQGELRGWESDNVRIWADRAKKAEALVKEQEKEMERYDKALQSLTPGGSEFVHDPERCVRFVQGVRSTEIDMIKRLVQKGKRSHD